MLSKEQAAEILLDINAVEISLTHPFRYASGLLSPIYTNCRVLSSNPRQRKVIIDTMAERLNSLKTMPNVIAAAGTSSIFLATLLAERLKFPLIYVRPSPKKHGKKKEIEGVLRKGDKVLVVSDVISTERDIPNSIDAIRKNDASVVHCLSIFSNQIGTIEAYLDQQHISYEAFTDLQTLLEIAVKKGIYSFDEKNVVEEWAKNPELWNDKRELAVRDLLRKIRRSVAHILLQIGAVSINTTQPFKYASGILSPIYTDNRLLISYPDKWKNIVDYFLEVMINIIGIKNFDLIAGTATSGIPHATLIADRLNLPLIYVRFESDGKDEHSLIEGKMNKGKRIVVIEDHITTGKSVLKTAKALREAGGVIDWCVVIFTYGREEAKLAFENDNVKLISLCDLSTLMDIAVENKFISFEDRHSVFEWLKNPNRWALLNKRPNGDTVWS